MKDLFFSKVHDLAKPTICSLKEIELKVEKIFKKGTFFKKSTWEGYSGKNVVQVNYKSLDQLGSFSLKIVLVLHL